MSTLLRWFSPAYRYALQAEAEGRYIEAARAYALCGQRLKVAEMHILEAERRGAPASALRELHVAAHFVGKESAASRALRLRLGQLYLRVLKKNPLAPTERELCAEAAELLLGAGDAASAGAAYELGGDIERAAAAYEQAGDIERVEALLGAAEARRQASAEAQDAFAAYRAHLELGQRAEALAALRRHTAAAAGTAAVEAQRLLFDLHQHFLPAGQVRLRSGSSETLYIGRFPLLLGRASTDAGGASQQLLSLPDLGLSRDHAAIGCGDAAGATTFCLRDLGSKNGTALSGLALAPGRELPLRGAGEIGLGPNVALRFAVAPSQLELFVERGLSRGLRIIASPRPLPLDGVFELSFSNDDGQPRLALAATSSSELFLNGKRAPRQIQLLRGDVVEAAGRRYEVA